VSSAADGFAAFLSRAGVIVSFVSSAADGFAAFLSCADVTTGP
jgi:hypothetical protein